MKTVMHSARRSLSAAANMRPTIIVDTAGRDAKGRWLPGISGNLAGRPPGAKDTYRRVRCEPLRPYRQKTPWKRPRYRHLSPEENIARAARLIASVYRDSARRR